MKLCQSSKLLIFSNTSYPDYLPPAIRQDRKAYLRHAFLLPMRLFGRFLIVERIVFVAFAVSLMECRLNRRGFTLGRFQDFMA